MKIRGSRKNQGLEKIRVSKKSAAIGRGVQGVLPGRGERSFESRHVEIGTRSVFDLGDSWLEVFSGLDAKGSAQS